MGIAAETARRFSFVCFLLLVSFCLVIILDCLNKYAPKSNVLGSVLVSAADDLIFNSEWVELWSTLDVDMQISETLLFMEV